MRFFASIFARINATRVFIENAREACSAAQDSLRLDSDVNSRCCEAIDSSKVLLKRIRGNEL